MAEYKKGQRIPLANGSNAEIIGKLGEGGQGTVYRVKLGGNMHSNGITTAQFKTRRSFIRILKAISQRVRRRKRSFGRCT